MYEHGADPVLSPSLFFRRMGTHGIAALGLIIGSMLVGTLGYHIFGHEQWIDALLNAAMLLGGMGQVGEVAGTGGKLFAAFFALYSGLLLIAVTTIVLAPVLHRILHRIHVERDGEGGSAEG